jgi:hypothetical protein
MTKNEESAEKSPNDTQNCLSKTPVSQLEIQWALALEERVKNQNYKPNENELAAYENIAKRLQSNLSCK